MARRCGTGSDKLQRDGQGQPHFHIPRVVLLVQAGKEIPSNPSAPSSTAHGSVAA